MGLSQKYMFFPLILMLIIGAILRFFAANTDFWLDEIWSWFYAIRMQSFWDIFFDFKNSNNHHLYTIYMFLIGNTKEWFIYRIPALVTGTLTIPLVWISARKKGFVEANIASLFISCSYLFIHFSSEARGYALVVFFSIAVFTVTQKLLDSEFWGWYVMIWLCMALGFLSHLMFIFTYIAIGAWVLYTFVMRRYKFNQLFIKFCILYGPPTIFLGIFYLLVIRRIKIGGGPSYELFNVLLKTTSYAGGGPSSGILALFFFVIVIGLFIGSIIFLKNKKQYEWIFYLIVIIVAPAVIFYLQKTNVLFIRYFLISIIFFYLSASLLLAHFYKRGGVYRIAAVTIIVIFLIGNTHHVIKLYHYGRGSYLQSLRYMESNTPGNQIRLATDHPFRNRMVLSYYEQFLSNNKKIIYISKYDPSQPPLWLILHRIGEPGEIKSALFDKYGNKYILKKHFPYKDLSGWHWFIYKNGT